jgi:putative flippase GtrA
LNTPDDREVFGGMTAMWAWLIADAHILARGLRFAFVGGFNGLLFTLITAVLVEHAKVEPTRAGVIAYGVSALAGFLSHKHISFRSAGNRWQEGLRFLIVQLANVMLTSFALYSAVWRLHIAFYYGVAAALICVPIVNFIVAHFWVFRESTGAR